MINMERGVSCQMIVESGVDTDDASLYVGFKLSQPNKLEKR